MWFWRNKKYKLRENLKNLTESVDSLAYTVGKITQDQRSLRGLVNRKMGNKLGDDEEDAGYSNVRASSSDLVTKFCIANGVNPKSVTDEMKKFIEETYDFKEWAQGQDL